MPIVAIKQPHADLMAVETLGVAYIKYSATIPGATYAAAVKRAAAARFTGARARQERELVGFREESGNSSADCKEPRPSEGGTRAGAGVNARARRSHALCSLARQITSPKHFV